LHGTRQPAFAVQRRSNRRSTSRQARWRWHNLAQTQIRGPGRAFGSGNGERIARARGGVPTLSARGFAAGRVTACASRCLDRFTRASGGLLRATFAARVEVGPCAAAPARAPAAVTWIRWCARVRSVVVVIGQRRLRIEAARHRHYGGREPNQSARRGRHGHTIATTRPPRTGALSSIAGDRARGPARPGRSGYREVSGAGWSPPWSALG
jgi:hypothetical protein